ncbi:MAG: sigma-70 family RNA polymerase sigma factor [Bryobacterales bacterium]|nr:sigma-70 family RNA polymerase sigma factor [Bryobacterales bacterium]
MNRREPMAEREIAAVETETITKADPILAPRPPEGEETWRRLTGRLRAGETDAPEEFLTAYRRGVRMLFRRYIGTIGTDHVVEEAMAGAVDGVRHGWIREPADMIYFMRQVISRNQHERQPGSRGLPAPGAAAQGVTETLRMRQKAAMLEQALRHFSAEEREALEGYYLRGEPLDSVLAVSGLPQSEFDRLKSRLYRVVSRKQAKVKLTTVAKVQTASGGGG